MWKDYPDIAVGLSKAAFTATAFYCTAVAIICGACTSRVLYITIAMTAGLAGSALLGTMVSNQQYRAVANILLPEPMFNVVSTAGILSGEGAGSGGRGLVGVWGGCGRLAATPCT